MKIGLVLDHFDPRRGGVEQWTDQFARQLLRLGHEVHVVATTFQSNPKRERGQPLPKSSNSQPGEASALAGASGYSVEPTWIVPHLIPPQRYRIERARSAEAILRQLGLDIVHDMGFGWYGDILQPHGGSRTAAEERNLMLLPKWMHPIKRVVYWFLPRYREFAELTQLQYGSPNGPVVLALSRMVYRDMQRLHGLPDSRLRLIYNGVDEQRFSPEWRTEHREPTRQRLGIAEDEVLFLIVAHNLKLKGVPTLIQALGRLRSEGTRAKVVVVGGKRTLAMRLLARWHGVDRDATFVGAIDDPRDFYAAADVYVQPTFYDPCSLVVLEALACGLPVVTTKFNGAGELMTVGEHGFLLDDPADSAGLAELMRQTLDPERRAAMSRAARELALRHTFEENVRSIVSVYEELANRPRNGNSDTNPTELASVE